MEHAIRFEELRWLQEVASTAVTRTIPDFVRVSLLKRGLIERHSDRFIVTAKGRIALAKLS